MSAYVALIALTITIFIAYIAFFSTPSSPPKNYFTNINPDKCSTVLTPSQTEGPYYKTGSPQRNNITERVSGEPPEASLAKGGKLVVSGYVYDKNCKPIANAWLDFWQADGNGVYDNEGFKLRGHQFTIGNGMYHLESIVPARYGTRPPHIHVKVKSPNGTILVSQMYFPNDLKNQSDPIFNQELIMNVKDTSSGKIAEFNFVLNQ